MAGFPYLRFHNSFRNSSLWQSLYLDRPHKKLALQAALDVTLDLELSFSRDQDCCSGMLLDGANRNFWELREFRFTKYKPQA